MHHRFAFGKNWRQFSRLIDESRVEQASRSLCDLLSIEDLHGKTFVDVGSGSGLMSLCAYRLGARVYSFDYDPDSVACTTSLRDQSGAESSRWQVHQGSVLDKTFMAAVPIADYIYAWGVLHHTGAMWLAVENCLGRTRAGSVFCVALYNDQGWKSHFWWFIKLLYNILPRPLNLCYGYVLGVAFEALNILKYTMKGKPMLAIRPLLQYKEKRGMSLFHDMIDWMGGFPFEFVDYSIFAEIMSSRGFVLVSGKQATSLGCHEWVLRRE